MQKIEMFGIATYCFIVLSTQGLCSEPSNEKVWENMIVVVIGLLLVSETSEKFHIHPWMQFLKLRT